MGPVCIQDMEEIDMFDLKPSKCSVCDADCMAESFICSPLCEECKKKAEVFWKEHKGEGQEHICDVSDDDFVKKHMHVLELAERSDPWVIGCLLMGDYHVDGFSSRSCSGRMAELMGVGDYMEYYCASSSYIDMKLGWTKGLEELLSEYEEADKRDREG